MRLKRKYIVRDLLTVVLLLTWIGLYVANDGLSKNALKKSGDIEQADPQSSDSEIPTVRLSEALQQSVNVNLDFQSFLLIELTLDEVNNKVISIPQKLKKFGSKSISTLLRRIISPNAP